MVGRGSHTVAGLGSHSNKIESGRNSLTELGRTYKNVVMITVLQSIEYMSVWNFVIVFKVCICDLWTREGN